MKEYPKTEEELIDRWLDLAGKEFGMYGWAGASTWAGLSSSMYLDDFFERDLGVFENKWGKRGTLGAYVWSQPKPFTIRILMDPFAEEGRVYLAHAGTKYLEYANL